MKYVVLVRPPVPDDLTTVVAQVAAGFRIAPDKAVALLRRAPGVVTRPVPEHDARVVAGILGAAGLVVEVREESADGRVVVLATESADEQVVAQASEPAEGTSAAGAAAVPAAGMAPASEAPPATEAPASVAPTSTTETPTMTPTPSTAATRDDEGEAPPSRHPTSTGQRTPVPGQTTTTPPRDPMKTTLTRNPPTLERGGLRRRVATAATLPAVVTLLVALLALAVTMLPAMRAEQQRRAGDVAAAMSTTIEGLAGGLPLSAPLVRAELARVGDRSRAELAASGVAFLAVVDADGSTLMSWVTGGAVGDPLPEDAMALARAQAGSGQAEQPRPTWSEQLGESWRSVLAMLGMAREPTTVAAAAVERLGSPVGAVVVGIAADGARSGAVQVFRTVLLVGLVPVLFAVLAALSLTRGLSDAIGYLLVATDRISHGDFERPVELRRDDELGQIAKAVERMRVSLREGMERLRRRR